MSRTIHSLRTRTLFYLLLLLSAVALASYWSTSNLLHQSLGQYEERHAQEELERVNVALVTDAQALLGSTLDYGFWDDSYEYLQQPSLAYLDSNFTADSMRNLRVDFTVFLTTAGALHSAFEFSGEQREHLATDSSTLRAVYDGLATLPATLQQQGAYLLRWIDGMPVVLAYSPIRDTDRSQPQRGWLVMGRRLDTNALARLEQLVGTPFQLAPTTTSAPALPTAPGSLRVSRLLADSLGPSAVHLIIQRPPILDPQKRDGDLLLLGNSLLILLLAALAATLLLDRLILKRLSRFSHLAEQRRRNAEQPAVWPVQGDDELDQLALSLNELMAEVHTAHESLYQEARRDPLTGLGNRKFLSERLHLYQAMQRRQPGLTLTLYLIDLDDFKLINDCLGHEAGDALLNSLAQRLGGLLRASDTAVRMGGDEFVVLSLTDDTGPGSHALAQRLLEAVCQPLMFQDTQLAISASIGIALAGPGTSEDELLRNADIALYQAKRAGKSGFAIFSATMHTNVQERMRIEQRLRQALALGQLEVWFQPIVDGESGATRMVEALARWPVDGGYCPPDKFIPVAEEAGLIGELGLYIAQRAIQALPRLQQARPGLVLNINLSVKQLLQVNLVGQLCELVDAERLSRHSVHFELTESAFSESLEVLEEQVNALVAAGFQLHLDDFGTGYSSLQRLQHLPMSALKLDKSFTRLLDEGDERIVKVILSLGELLQLRVIAEGVETEQQRERLQILGCRLMQGYLFAKPMPEQQLLDWLPAPSSTAGSV
ncbi:EAL domain-containing protein [Pseudomonas cavernae]|uniref:EAL domain-containing protein n=1 Tax=Pseudomonas cavernae TaxID=2320867 RepID=A0A385Z4G4_9PSED|nr:EAL domain-containing protein [Pseudomonas cavernae]AYC32977.1 EAL domain-containing protein [Pseudomonas cavernae]